MNLEYRESGAGGEEDGEEEERAGMAKKGSLGRGALRRRGAEGSESLDVGDAIVVVDACVDIAVCTLRIRRDVGCSIPWRTGG
jgi:hypothetical protein